MSDHLTITKLDTVAYERRRDYSLPLFDWHSVPASLPVVDLHGVADALWWRLSCRTYPSLRCRLLAYRAAGLRVTTVKEIRRGKR